MVTEPVPSTCTAASGGFFLERKEIDLQGMLEVFEIKKNMVSQSYVRLEKSTFECRLSFFVSQERADARLSNRHKITRKMQHKEESNRPLEIAANAGSR